MIARIIECLIVAASAEYLERWSYEHGVVDIHPWSPAPVQAAWQIVMVEMGDELEAAVTAWNSPPDERLPRFSRLRKDRRGVTLTRG